MNVTITATAMIENAFFILSRFLVFDLNIYTGSGK